MEIKKWGKYKLKSSVYFDEKYGKNLIIRIEDTTDEVFGKNWVLNPSYMGNPAVMQYMIRAGFTGLSHLDTYYGKVQGLGEIVHVSELLGETE